MAKNYERRNYFLIMFALLLYFRPVYADIRYKMWKTDEEKAVETINEEISNLHEYILMINSNMRELNSNCFVYQACDNLQIRLLRYRRERAEYEIYSLERRINRLRGD